MSLLSKSRTWVKVVLTRVRKIRLVEKKRALGMAGHLGMFKDTVILKVNPTQELMESVAANSKPLPAKP